MSKGTTTRDLKSLPRVFALGVGVVYLLLGMAGFVFAENGELGVFGAGVLLNIVRTVIGLAGLATAWWSSAPRAYCLAVFFALTGFTAFGILTASTGRAEDVNMFLQMHTADNWLHGVTAVLALLSAFGPTRRA